MSKSDKSESEPGEDVATNSNSHPESADEESPAKSVPHTADTAEKVVSWQDLVDNINIK